MSDEKQPKVKVCPDCNGDKFVECDGDHDCEQCDNSGSVFSQKRDDWVECGSCDGPGSLPCDNEGCEYGPMAGTYFMTCPTCRGEETAAETDS